MNIIVETVVEDEITIDKPRVSVPVMVSHVAIGESSKTFNWLNKMCVF